MGETKRNYAVKTLDVLRVISFPFRYGVVLGLAYFLTPSLFKTVFNPHVNSELRPMMRFVKDSKQTCLIGAEVGVFKGNHAVSIIANLPMEKLYLIDPYLPYEQDGVVINPSVARLVAFQILKKVKDKISWVNPSHLPNNLHFIYIDGNHQYEAVKADIHHYYEKIKYGGVLGGHDFSNRFEGVIRAVTEFTLEKNLRLFVEQPDWWIIKK